MLLFGFRYGLCIFFSNNSSLSKINFSLLLFSNQASPERLLRNEGGGKAFDPQKILVCSK